MGKTVIKETMFPEIVELYNSQGKAAAAGMLRSEFGIRYPYHVFKRIKKSADYTYDGETDRFICTKSSRADDVFMDLDELCRIPDVGRADPVQIPEKPMLTMEALVNELINDRLLTLSRYITLDTASRTVLIDQSSLTADGYQVMTH